MEPWTLTPGLDETSRWAFIVGAPRCGTTAMSEYLRGHPEVCFSTPKEPHYFLAHDLRGKEPVELSRDRPRQISRALLSPTGGAMPSSPKARSAISTAPEQLEPILRLWPRAKFLIAVRNPLELVPSLHQRLFYNGDENQRQFDRAWVLTCRARAPGGRSRAAASSRASSTIGKPGSSASIWSISSAWWIGALPCHALRRLQGRSRRRVPQGARIP